MDEVVNSERVIVVGDEASAELAGLDSEPNVELVSSLEEAVESQKSNGPARIVLDPAFLRSTGVQVLDEQNLQSQHGGFECCSRLLDDFVRSAPAAIAILHPEPPYKVILCNEAYQQLWAEPFRSEDMVGRGIAEFSPRVGEADILTIFGQVAETRQTVTFREQGFDSADRGKTWWNWSLSPVTRDGELVALAHVLIDVTDQVLAHRQVNTLADETEMNRDLLQAIIDNASAAVFVKDLDGRLIAVNQRLADALGTTKEELIGKTSYDVYPPDVAEEHVENDREVMRSGRPWESEEIIPQDGGEHTFLSLKFPLRDSSGEVCGVGGISTDITARKQAERARVESEEKYRALFSRMSEGFALGEIVWDEHGNPIDFRYLELNPAFTENTGIPVEQAVGRRVSEVIPGIEPYWAQTFGEVVRTGEPAKFENQVAALDKWFEVYAFRHSENRFGAVFFDVTERRTAEKELNLFKFLAERSNDPFYIINPDAGFRLVYVNEAACRHFGMDCQKLLTMTIPDFSPLFAPDYLPVFWEQLKSRGSMVFETLHRHADGHDIPVEVSANYLVYEDQKLLAGWFRDITERKQAQEALEKRESEYRALAENSPEVIARFDRQLRHTYINDYGTRVYGIPKEQVIGKTNAELGMPPDRVALWRERFEEVLESGEQQTVDFEFDSPDLGHQYFSSLFVPEFDEQGRVGSILAITRDVTDQLEAQAALELSNKRLELLSEVASQLLTSEDPIGEIAPVCTKALGYLECDAYINFLADEGDEHLHLNSWYGIPAETLHSIQRLDYGEAVCGRVAECGRTVVVRSVQDSAEASSELIRSMGMAAYACNPILSQDGRVLGTLSFGSRTRESFTENQLAVMKAIANQFATAIDRKRLFEAERRRAEEAEEGRRILDAMMEHVPEGITIVGGPPDYQIIRVSAYGQQITGRSRHDLEKHKLGEHIQPWGLLHKDGSQPIPEQLPLYRAVRYGEVVNNEEWLIERPDGARVPLLVNSGPIRDENGDIMGGVIAWRDITERKQAEEELSRAREDAERRAAQLQSWFSSMADGVTLLDSRGDVTMLNEAGKELLDVTGDRLVGSIRERTKWYTLDGMLVPAEETATFEALLKGVTIKEARYRIVTVSGKEVIVSVSAAPVRDSRGSIIGAVNVFRDAGERVQVERQQKELLERERRIADALQKALVPPDVPHRIGEYHVAVRYQSALREAEIGGDFYDVFELGSGKICVLIGDVAGKGLPAAIRVAAARYAIRSYAYLDWGPAKVMQLANEALYRDRTDESGMLTAFLAVVDTNANTVTYSNAGHEPPAMMNEDGSVDELTSQGVPLSVLDNMDYSEASRTFKPGERIVMVTDGITEARNENVELYEKSGLIHYLQKHRFESGDEVADGILAAAKAHAGGHLQDDAAIVVFEHMGQGR